MASRRRWSLMAIGTLALITACSDGSQPTGPDLEPALNLAPAQAGRPIPDQYIVVFKDDVGDVEGTARRLAGAQGGRVGFVYQHAIKGFSVNLNAQAAAALGRNPNVAYVEQDQEVTLTATQTGATWGLDRIDQRSLPLSTTYSYTSTGAGVTAYIIDTGILLGHTQFGGRAVYGYDAVGGRGAKSDCNGHGTHVAGTVGGSAYGVAKGVTLIAVRVLNCRGSGSWSGVIAGVDWVKNHHTGTNPAVANMSLGGGVSSTVDAAVANAIADGVTFAIAAGNSNANACNYSPARVPTALTVGATTSTDARASYSNFGTCLDLFAPGSSITSAWYTSTTATNTISGTSMASPHMAGVAALYLQGNQSASPAAVATAVTTAATTGVVGSPGTGSPNRLLFTGY